MKIVWIASYPRSGNTWVRLLLHHYLFGEIDNTDLVDERIPDLHLWINKDQALPLERDGTVMVKTHFRCTPTHPYIEHTSAFIYILRNPRDVLVSNLRVLCSEDQGRKARQLAHDFIDQFGIPAWRDRGMGTWPQHISTWLHATVDIPHLFVRYEDLRADTENCLAEMIRFLGKKPDTRKVREAVSSCALDRIREVEKNELELGRTDFFSATSSGANFVGEGQMAQSLNFVDADVERRFRARFSSVSKLFGYD